MDQLAPELLGAIADLLDVPELASLSVCSKSLQEYIEPILYDSRTLRNKAMRWACAAGNLHVIRQAIAHGASASLVEGPAERVDGDSPRPVRVLTLYLAAKHDRADAFSLLLKLGARLDVLEVDGIKSEVKKVMRWLCSHPDLLQTFLEDHHDTQIKVLHCHYVTWPLIPALENNAPPSLLRLLVDRGASPNQVFYNPRRGIESPLSAAIWRYSQESVDVLIEKGADIHGRDIFCPINNPTQIPVFAAAKAMAISDEGRPMMQQCLKYGGNINHVACAYNLEQVFYWTTPLLVYLDSVPSWTENGQHQKIIDGLAYLFEQGALASAPEKEPPQRITISHKWISSPLSSVQHLIKKWELEVLADDKQFSVVQLLVQHGISMDHMRRLVDEEIRNITRPNEAAVAGWRRLLGALLTQQQVDANLLLFHVIVDKGKAYYYHGTTELPELYKITIDSLLEHGADINAPVGSEGMAALHELCEYYSRVSTDPTCWDGYELTTVGIVTQRIELLGFIKQKGADPNITHEGKTAIDALRSRIDRATEWGRSFLDGASTVLGSLDGIS